MGTLKKMKMRKKDAPPELEEGVKATIDALKEVNLGTDEEPRPTYLSALLEVDEESTYIELLKEFRDVFAWSYKEMTGLDPKVAIHHLAVKNGARPVKQAQSRFRPDLVPLIETEVNKLIEAGFIWKFKYPTWVSSIVLVRKKNGQIRVSVNFRDLNNVCPKEEFPLPIPEMMIDATTGYKAMSFMDGLSCYNQIHMAPKDEELTAFCTPKGIYCYKAIKGQALAYFLADHPIPDDLELTDEQPDEDAMVIEVQPPWKMYFDGAAHHGGAGAGVVFVISQGEVLPYSFTLTQLYSNNVAEYQALILGLEMAIEMKRLQLQVFSDSQLVINQLLGNPKRRIEIRRRAPHFLFYKDTLYRKSFEGVILQCLGEEKALQALQEAHSGGLDVVGPLSKSSGGHIYILVATDYFSKWAEVVALKEVKKENVASFIKQRNSSMYNVAANGLAEAFNKTLCKLLKKVISKSKRDWHDRMEEALWAYKTNHCMPTQATPYSLVYGVEVVLPLERQIPSLRLAIREGIADEEDARLQLAALEALNEKRL
ncbi:uncharacterized protein [Nicotiana tomentosiformis]|uniref:uncharacterized protein n=1 Tax=Nicotiana tomentosiformis TaxID=4098 RepID=UPI00388C945F